MIKRIFILVGLVLLFGGVSIAQDLECFSERDIMGTARYVGMAGAMNAVGGDPSAVLDNPAGLGLYQRMEIAMTMQGYFDYNKQVGYDYKNVNRFQIPQISWVFSWNYSDHVGRPFFSNFMVGYNRLKSFNRVSWALGNDMLYSLADVAANQADGLHTSFLERDDTWDNVDVGWLTNLSYWNYLINPTPDSLHYIPCIEGGEYINNALTVEESGYLDEYNFSWAGNIDHQWYIGVSLGLRALSYSKRTHYEEVFERNDVESFYLGSSITQSGIGVNGTFGIIYRPIRMLRLGASIQTPTSFAVSTRTQSWMKSNIVTQEVTTPLSGGVDNYSLPMRLSTGLAFQMKNFGLLSMQYDYRHHKDMRDVHTMKVGVEGVIAKNLFLNAGYAYESSFAKEDDLYGVSLTTIRTDLEFKNPKFSHYVGVGVGYRGRIFIAQAAYQMKMQTYHLHAHEYQDMPYEMNALTHRVVLTLSWHD